VGTNPDKKPKSVLNPWKYTHWWALRLASQSRPSYCEEGSEDRMSRGDRETASTCPFPQFSPLAGLDGRPHGWRGIPSRSRHRKRKYPLVGPNPEKIPKNEHTPQKYAHWWAFSLAARRGGSYCEEGCEDRMSRGDRETASTCPFLQFSPLAGLDE